jgi:P-type Ca2+ transporter type 2C
LDPHAASVADVLAELDSRPAGLSEDEAVRRLQQYGPNRFELTKPVSALKILGDQLRSIVVALLVVASVISLTLGDWIEAAAIAVVLAINTVIGFVTELRARRAMAALLRLDVPRALVVRGGQVHGVDAHGLVPGDVIAVSAGQQVPADGRVIEEVDLRSDEASLTGESMPVSKSTAVLPPDTPLADRTNMVYKGTTVVAGTARVLVTATGGRTEIGRIGILTGGVHEERTPLERRLDELGRRLVWLALAVAALVAVLGAFQGAPLALVIEMGIALAVGVSRMARRRALVRRLPAVEALGSTTVVCTDKTRTLTSGDMTVVRLWAAGQDVHLSRGDGPTAIDPSLRHAFEVAALASRGLTNSGSDAAAPVSDPVDTAFLRAADLVGIDHSRLVEERPPEGFVPFSSERKWMAAFHRLDGVLNAYVKGAPRQVLAVAGQGPDGQPLDDSARQKLMSVNETYARAGLRVLALAFGPVEQATEAALKNLTFVGFVGLMDPPAPGVRETIGRLRAAGLRTVMLTGDQRLTAQAVGQELGVLSAETQIIDGRQLDAMSQQELETKVTDVSAFSRINPEHKLSIVSAMQSRGEIVAMLGDGINDAAALKKADVGVAMGIRGTDVAKEAASIVLQDDRFETIAAAVEEGRIIFDNIRKFVFYLFSCNVAEVFVLLGCAVAGLPMPLMPLQVLWLNMVTDTFPALALALEPGESDVMNRPPRDPREAILSRQFLTSILLYGGLITASTLAAYLWSLREAPQQAVTVAFMVLALAQTFHLGNARSSEPVLSLAHIGANRYALGAIALTVGLQLAAMYVEPLARVLRVVRLGGREWAVVLVLSALPAVVGQALKLWQSRHAELKPAST